MGQNKYGTWDDAKMEANERKFQKRMRAANERFVIRYNTAMDSIRRLRPIEICGFRPAPERQFFF